MGLDISVCFDNEEELFDLDEFEEIEESSNLSRTFVNFMSRRNVVDDQPELDQLGELTNTNIDFLYAMEEYVDESEMDDLLDDQDDNAERSRQEQEILAQNEIISNNITNVKNSLIQLIEKLNDISDLENKLAKTTHDTIGRNKYFSAFKENPGDGYIGNNLGQDLRNLLKIVDFSSKNGSTTVYFNYE